MMAMRFGIDIGTFLQIVDHRAEDRLCRRGSFDRAFTDAGHVDGAARHAVFLQAFVIFVTLRFK